MPSHYMEYVDDVGKTDTKSSTSGRTSPRSTRTSLLSADFTDHRNRFGGLFLLPKSFNASFGALPYPEEMKHYYAQNLLARSLHPDCYERNPGFAQFVQQSGLPFKPKEEFNKADLEERQSLYRAIAEQVWKPDRLLQEVGL